MGYRRYKYRKPQRRRHYAPSRQSHSSLGDETANLAIEGFSALLGMIARAATQLWRKITNRPYTNPPAPVSPASASPANRAAATTSTPRIQPPRMPYERASGLLTKGERALWHPLRMAVKDKYCLFCKVRLADVVCCAPSNRNERHWFNLIGHFHVDFVLCDPHTTAPLLVIELDDRSHLEGKQSRRDGYKDKALQSAGLSIHRIPAQAAYDPIELAKTIDRLLQTFPAASHVP
jgi:hypothetical protein